MNICVLSGSPKGENSITYQTVRYIEKLFPKDRFETVHVGKRIRSLEKDMSPALEAVKKADALLFCYPVYTFIAPYQLQRFIELLKESGADVSGKFAVQITTSKHFYDVTAHEYVKQNCEDMGLIYLGGLTQDMDDLLCERGRREAEAFWRLTHFKAGDADFAPCSRDKKIVVVADIKPGDGELKAMIDSFSAACRYETRVVDLERYPFAGGCLGCFNCASTGKCVYKDGFDDFLRNDIQTSDAIVYAFRIKDHSMGSRMKLYDDRQFCNGHRTVTSGMPMGYLIAGDLAGERNLRTIIEARAEVGGNFLAGAVNDEKGVSRLAKTLEYAIENKLTQPASFYGVGGMKIFRDLIWLMRGMMKADHKFYAEHGLYDFPQKKIGTVIKMKLVGMLISNPKLMSKMGGKMTEGMLKPYQKALDEAKKSSL